MCFKTISPVALLSIFLLHTNSADAQNYKYELGLNLGAYVYQGDLSPQRLGSFKTIRPGIGISFGKPLSNTFSVRGIFNLASLKGNEAKYSDPEYRQYRAFAFKTSVKELGVHLQYNILGNREYWPTFEPYVFAGVSAAFINTKKDYSAFDATYFGEARAAEIMTAVTVDNTERNRRTMLNLPAGLGVRYNLNNNWAVSTEANFRFGGSDYIDGFSQSVNPAKKDHFFSQNVGVAYRIGSGKTAGGGKLGCPAVN
ncbi:MAG: outer membrane beta-barrel protein [Rhizobacter sp.]|nr:outer membrane beta-barrel protein [Ferruginibacter sp.]